MDKSTLFTPGKISPLTLGNRTIRAVAFESMCPGNAPSERLFNYHTSVAAGGIGTANIAYVTVTQSGLSFERRLWMHSGIIPNLHKLTDAIHKEGAAASIQLGHCDNMSHKRIRGCTPILASSGFSLYSPTIIRGMRQSEIASVARAYGEVMRLAREVGMDAVEIHAGHGYLVNQPLSPYTDHRKDEYGGSLENRMYFIRMCMEEVMKAVGSDVAVTARTNMRGGFRGRPEIDECLEVARTLQGQYEAHVLVLSGGFVSHASIRVMRGEMPIRTIAYYMSRGYLLIGVRVVGKYMTLSEPSKETYLFEDTLKFRKALRLLFIYVGGLASRDKIGEALNDKFEFVTMARALVNEPGSINRMKEGEHARCDCGHSNYCIARMYSEDMVCHKSVKGPPECIVREIRGLKYK